MSFDLQTNGNQAQITLTGEIDLQITGDLKSCLDQLRQITHLDIHAGAVSYIDSSGIAVLLHARQLASQIGFQFTISSLSSNVFQVLKVACLDGLLPIQKVMETAHESTDAFGLSLAPTPTLNPAPTPSQPVSPETEPVVSDVLSEQTPMPLAPSFNGPDHLDNPNNPNNPDNLDAEMEAAISATAGQIEPSLSNTNHNTPKRTDTAETPTTDEKGPDDSASKDNLKPGSFF
jgi:anti-anti-sigma factor